MTLLWMIFVPAAAGIAALALNDAERRPWLLPLAASGHAALVLRCWIAFPGPAANGWLSLDSLGLIVLSVASLLFLGCSVYGIEYLRQSKERDNRLFVACFLFMQAAASLVALSRHMGLLWVGMEATTLASAPLINFKNDERSLEATWKYLILCSVGVGLALLGTFFMALAGAVPGGGDSLLLDGLLGRGPALSIPWLKGAFVFLLVGYGTKMGLSPLHFWKPDAYGEAPGMAGAVLSTVLTSCAFMGILRSYQVCLAAGQADFARSLLILMGLLSLGTAAVFMISQRDFKRLLAYSSVEHMGILALGLGVGGAGIFAVLLHLVNNALAKGVLFLTAGNIHRTFGDKTLDHVRGALRRLPISGGLFLLGFMAITGSPPFGPFISEFALLRATVSGGHWSIAIAFTGLLGLIFIGMADTALSVVQGVPQESKESALQHDSALLVFTPCVFAVGVLALGLYLPPWLVDALSRAAEVLSGGKP